MRLFYLRAVGHAKKCPYHRKGRHRLVCVGPRLRARTTIAKTKKFVKEVRKIFKMEQTPRAAKSDGHRSFDETLNPFMLSGVRKMLNKVGFILRMKNEKDSLDSFALFQNSRPGPVRLFGSNNEYCIDSAQSPYKQASF